MFTLVLYSLASILALQRKQDVRLMVDLLIGACHLNVVIRVTYTNRAYISRCNYVVVLRR